MERKIIKQKSGLLMLTDESNTPCMCPFAAVPVIPVSVIQDSKIMHLNNQQPSYRMEPQYRGCTSNCPHFNLSQNVLGSSNNELTISCGSGMSFPKINVVEESEATHE